MTLPSPCPHKNTHKENIFIDLEDDGSISYDIYEICDDCRDSWQVGCFEDNGQILGKQMLGVF